MLLRLKLRRRLAAERGVRLAKHVRIEVDEGARVELRAGCRLGEGTRLVAHGGTLRVGRDAVLGARCIVVAHAGVDVGDGCRLGDWVTVTDFEPVADSVEPPLRTQGVHATPVRLAPGAVIDHGATLLAGVQVGEDAHVGAHAVVSGDVPAGGSADGAPAQVRAR
jgi:acetyltransferase-like isoleucine patch superfamily enzyme